MDVWGGKKKKDRNLEAMEKDQKGHRRLGQRGARSRNKKMVSIISVTLLPYILPMFFSLPPPMQFLSFSVV